MSNYSSSMEVMYDQQRSIKKKKLSIVNPVLFLVALAAFFLPGELKFFAWGMILLVFICRKTF